MTQNEVFILIGMCVVLLVVGMLVFAPKETKSDLEADYDEADFQPIFDNSYADYDDYKQVSDSLRANFLKANKPQHYYKMLDWFDDEVWIKSEVKKHYHALKKNTDKKIRKNDYGAVVHDGRADEIIEFLESVNFSPKRVHLEHAIEVVLNTLENFTRQVESFGFDPSTIPSDGFEFEGWVATNLKKFGWEAKATQGSGDQGLDVIATKNGCKVGVQCKLYSSNVGNKAVQEINAAKAHFNLDKVAVLTNAGYTKSARELAMTCDVQLLSHYDIPRFDELFLGGKT